ncbi:uncharacterized protein CIMG_00353 [Coccidioides immitis RS]|uniref:Uncharacterized protein n=1 Tax=Coccidioides immitis (strain RS) TaxID=246410 RepID=A0A0D8JSR8_COCIM|nr:uncharacterized protein CIMG_00353 [Coccidioides immitis RS]KJF60332.1 hypothetical protein CIMG_00353 [Coccidioides immitis RS]
MSQSHATQVLRQHTAFSSNLSWIAVSARGYTHPQSRSLLADCFAVAGKKFTKPIPEKSGVKRTLTKPQVDEETSKRDLEMRSLRSQNWLDEICLHSARKGGQQPLEVAGMMARRHTPYASTVGHDRWEPGICQSSVITFVEADISTNANAIQTKADDVAGMYTVQKRRAERHQQRSMSRGPDTWWSCRFQ